jgi:predicted kinase
MHAVVFSGIQGSGKSTFYRDRFLDTHVRINLDMLRSRNREGILLHACLAAHQPFVIDNTNPTAAQRTRYVRLAKASGFSVELYYFVIDVEHALRRNAGRPDAVPELAVRGTAAKAEWPTIGEGFDVIRLVRIDADGNPVVEPWQEATQ